MNPPFHGNLRPAAFQSFEYQARIVRMIPDEFQCFLTDGDDVFRLCLLGDDVHAFASSRIVHNILPTQGENVADAQACQAGEKRCGLYNRYFAFGLSQSIKFFYGKEIFDNIFCLNFLQKIVHVGTNEFVTVQDFQEATEC